MTLSRILVELQNLNNPPLKYITNLLKCSQKTCGKQIKHIPGQRENINSQINLVNGGDEGRRADDGEDEANTIGSAAGSCKVPSATDQEEASAESK